MDDIYVFIVENKEAMRKPPNNWIEQKQTAGERLSQFGRINGDYTIPTKTKHKILICECGNRY
jgi:hypothetical protein